MEVEELNGWPLRRLLLFRRPTMPLQRLQVE